MIFAVRGLPVILSANIVEGYFEEEMTVSELPVQAYDIFMLVLLILTTLFGFWKGLAWQVASIGSVVLSYFVAVRYAGELAPSISNESPWNRHVAMLLLYLLTSLVVWMAFRVVAKLIDRVQLKDFDRQAGALVGLGKGILLCLVVTFFAVTLSEPARQAVLQTKSGRYMAILIQRAAPSLPGEVRKQLGQYIDELDQKLRPENPAEPGVNPGAVNPGALPSWQQLRWPVNRGSGKLSAASASS